jgi:hypothetical protein
MKTLPTGGMAGRINNNDNNPDPQVTGGTTIPTTPNYGSKKASLVRGGFEKKSFFIVPSIPTVKRSCFKKYEL